MDDAVRERLAELPPAGLMRRLGALVYDGLLVVALLLTTAGIANLFAPRPEIPADAESISLEHMQTVSGPLLGGLLLVVVFAFFAYFWIVHGRTLGMQAWRLRVQTPDGDNINFTQAWQRFLTAIPSLALGGVGFFWMWLDPTRRTWHDRMSGTRVVAVPPDLDPDLAQRR
ncbi:MAG: RDD family protein [Gammaproteobacteria bacterium]|nr:MAG: RDD family protein [Gammaproteobacteria bacterium]